MPRPNKQNTHLKQIRNIKKMNSDNELNKNLGYTSGEDPDKEIDNDFIYETDNSGDEWFNETISGELDDAFIFHFFFIKIYNNNVTPNTKSDKLNGNPLTTRQHK